MGRSTSEYALQCQDAGSLLLVQPQGTASLPHLLGSHLAHAADKTAAWIKATDAKYLEPTEMSGLTDVSASELSQKRSLKDNDVYEPCRPSVGSSLHEQGQCRPCAWFWKLDGCKNGADCHHCHLCPEDEIRNRRRAKALTFLHSSLPPDASQLSLSESRAQLKPESKSPSPDRSAGCGKFLALPSIGSELHDSGQCRPCAWLYKADGCRNGSQCCHCHSCPKGEMKVRKKEKLTAILRRDFVNSEANLEGTLCHEGSCLEPLDTADLLAASATLAMPSRGALLHGTGSCKPCGWFWKEQGCKNGRDCNHCHACPKEAIRARKHAKAHALTMAGTPSLATRV